MPNQRGAFVLPFFLAVICAVSPQPLRLDSFLSDASGEYLFFFFLFSQLVENLPV
jgi:hypothetical protein